MNICFFCGDLSRSGGTEKITQLIAEGIVNQGYHTVFAVDVVNANRKLYYSFNDEVRIEHLKSGNMLAKMKELYYFLKFYDIDVLINVDIMLIMYSYFPARMSNTKIVSWEQFNYYNDIGSSHTQRIRQFCLKHTDYYVNLTKGDMETFIHKFKVCIPITYIYNPVVGKKTNHYNSSSKTLITAGHFYVAKGYDYCIKVGEIVFSKHPEWSWIFCGDGIEFDTIKKMAFDSKCPNNFVFVGRVKNVQEYMQDAAMYVSCSITEGFGLVLLEAQQCGLPVVSFDVPFGPGEIILDNVNGYLIENLDVEMMAEKIIYLIEHVDLREDFSKKSNASHNEFALESILQQWNNVFFEVML